MSAVGILLAFGTTLDRARCGGSSGNAFDPERLRARVEAFHEALALQNVRKARRMISPHLRECEWVKNLATHLAKEPAPQELRLRCRIGEIEREELGSGGELLKFECGQGAIRIEAAFEVEILDLDPASGECEHRGYEGWLLYKGDFYFVAADEA